LFDWLSRREPFDQENKLRDFMERLNTIPGVNLRESDLAKRPRTSLATFADENNGVKLFSALEWLIDEVSPR
jgi:hypothetical protein